MLRKFCIFGMIFALLFTSVPVSAGGFRDVPANHFAAEAIAWVSSPQQGSFMVGDASNNFNPNQIMDMFETSITLAMAAGFRYTGITPAMQAAFDRAYSNHSAVLAELSAGSPRWRRGVNREIAYLLELGILTRRDLDLFLAQSEGVLQPAQLTKEAAAAFILRLSGNHTADVTAAITFSDESAINEMYRRYAYIAWQKGLVGDYDGYFMPRRTISRAEFALLAHHFRIAAPDSPGAATGGTPVHVPPATPAPPATGAPVHIPPATPTPPASAAPEATPAAQVTPAAFREIVRGHITIIGDEFAWLYINTGATGAAGTAVNRHYFAAAPVLVVHDQPAEAAALRVGMEVVAGLNNELQIASMLARDPVTAAPSPAAPVTPAPVPSPAAPVAPAPTPAAPDIGVPVIPGFIIEAIIPDDDGLLSTVTGTLEEIHIAYPNSHLVVRRGAARFLYILPDEIYNIYNLRRGMELRLYLQGREIYGLAVESAPEGSADGDSFIAYIRALRHGHTMVVEEEDGTRHTLRLGSETINTANGEALNFRILRTNMRLYIVLEDETVRSVTILP